MYPVSLEPQPHPPPYSYKEKRHHLSIELIGNISELFCTNIKQNLYTIYSQQILKYLDAKVATCALTPKNKVNTKKY